MTWAAMFEALAKLAVPISITYDRDYGIDKRSGFTVCIRGCIRSQFMETAEEAMHAALIAEAFCGGPSRE